ncbi:hypothetical protein BST81_06400 [Leptolyngbya sp. 'hensonii']|uniref:FxLYD domain-containing protein n=1 Tax=Leptolyngbya sp. 'hensonii' TaxID=1922337 RepID=UPI0009503447|nr:FxLYD domain-containing protein [Leptolyngbya sp. 'hensonii']OLP19375.1 hypothetical protein BST81_06400 [Leptolyngbya sp. 'hensonii']
MTQFEAFHSAANPDPRSTTDLALELARQGDPVIIATLMNRLLEPAGVSATAQVRGNCLQITLSSKTVPDRDNLVKFTQQGLLKLRPTGITHVILSGQQIGSTTPAWSTEFPLNPASKDAINRVFTQPRVSSEPRLPFNPHPCPQNQAFLQSHPAPQPRPLASSQQPSQTSSRPDRTWLGHAAAILVTITFSLSLIGYVIYQLVIATRPDPATSPQASTTPSKTPGSGKSEIKLLEFTWQTRYANPNLVGHIQNTSGRRYAYVKLEFNLYDEAGKPAGDAMAIVTQLDPKSTKEFEAPIVEPKAKKATLKAITAF